MSKPETVYIRRVHRLLPLTYAEKMSNPWRMGTADCWYSGHKGDLWIEYKWLPKLPKSVVIPDCTGKQLEWLEGRYLDGRNVAVVVGLPLGALLYRDMTWVTGKSPDKVISNRDLADWIIHEVGKSPTLI